MAASAYTLLIVESAFTARSIRSLNLPGLEVLSSGGYAWKPDYDPKTGRLKAKADPAFRPFRNELKKKAAWAISIVVAADSDPSGYFIAHTIRKALKDREVRFTHINLISKDDILKQIQNARKEPEYSEELLRRLFAIRQHFSSLIKTKSGRAASVADYVAMAILTHPVVTKYWLDSYNELGISNKAVQIARLDEEIELHQPDNQEPFFHGPPPPSSLARVLEPLDGSFSAGYESVTRLFSTLTENSGHTLISYPRTQAECYTESVWDMLTVHFTISDSDFTGLPTKMRKTCANPIHPSIYVTQPAVKPDDVRPLVKKRDYGTYKRIYEQTKAAVSIPEKLQQVTGTHIASGAQFSMRQKTNLAAPLFTCSDFMQCLLDTGWIKPSGLATTMDQLIRKDIIRIEQNPVLHVNSGRLLNSIYSDKDGFMHPKDLTLIYQQIFSMKIPIEDIKADLNHYFND